jgi:hypothetical protein
VFLFRSESFKAMIYSSVPRLSSVTTECVILDTEDGLLSEEESLGWLNFGASFKAMLLKRVFAVPTLLDHAEKVAVLNLVAPRKPWAVVFDGYYIDESGKLSWMEHQVDLGSSVHAELSLVSAQYQGIEISSPASCYLAPSGSRKQETPKTEALVRRCTRRHKERV